MPFVDNQGIKIHYKVEGEGIPFVLLYGFMDSLEDWYNIGFVDSLQDNYKLILIELRGHGLSDKPHNSKLYSMNLLTSDVVAVLDELEIEKAHFLGYSMGGHIGFGLTQFYPDRFLSLILGGISHYIDDEIKEKALGLLKILEEGLEAYLKYLESVGQEITSEVRKEMEKFDFKALAAFWGADLFPGNKGFYREVEVPIMLYVGEEDGWGHYPRALEFTKETKNATLYSFPDVGHELHYTRDMVIPSVLEFLRNIE
jgi:pimeloyl-ACP methyl ester carboxylesterase